MQNKTIGQELIESATEALAFAKGEPNNCKVHVPSDIDVTLIRKKLSMTQPEFASKFGFSLRTLQEWEQKKRRPSGAARCFLTVIDKAPDTVRQALSH